MQNKHIDAFIFTIRKNKYKLHKNHLALPSRNVEEAKKLLESIFIKWSGKSNHNHNYSYNYRFNVCMHGYTTDDMEGIDFSENNWYNKLCEHLYDLERVADTIEYLTKRNIKDKIRKSIDYTIDITNVHPTSFIKCHDDEDEDEN